MRRFRRGEGSIHHRKDGRFEVRLSVGVDANGQRLRLYFYRDTAAQAEIVLAQERDRWARDRTIGLLEFIQRSDPTSADLIGQVIAILRQRQASEAQRRQQIWAIHDGKRTLSQIRKLANQ